MQLDTTSYRKDRKHPLQHGYGVSRPGGPSRRSLSAIRAILIHTTNNRKGNTHYVPEAAFLRDDTGVSAHYVVSSHDQAVVQILGETEIAWHAGDCADNDYENETSIGIEIAWTINKGPLPQQAIDNVTDLVRAILQRCPQIRKIDMHRAQAIDKNGRLGRKVDPSGWATPDFYAWRDALFAVPTLAVPAPPARRYRVRYGIDYAQVRQGRGASFAEASIAGTSARFKPGAIVEVDDIKDGWAHLASGLGFVSMTLLEMPVGNVGLTFVASPRISKTTFVKVLRDANSPAAAEGESMYDGIASVGVDPAVGLAFFKHESTFGKFGICKTHDTKNIGNVRRAHNTTRGRQLDIAGRGPFWQFDTWTQGAIDWAERMRYRYAEQQGLDTVEKAIPIYAPSSDNNKPAVYIASVTDDVKAWQAMEATQ